MSDAFEWDDHYVRLSVGAAERAGFPVPDRLVQVSAAAGLAHVESRRRRALDALGELQTLTNHDAAEVAEAATCSLHECLSASVARGPAAGPRQGLDRVLGAVEVAVAWLWTSAGRNRRCPEAADSRSVLRLRAGLMLWTLLAALASAFLLASGRYGPALALLMTAVGADLVEGAVGRITRVESPVERWLACVVSHLSELVVIIGVACDQLRLGHPRGSTAVLVAGIAAIFGTYVRVSALQAGLCFWRSLVERAARLLSVLVYLGLSLLWTGAAVPAAFGLMAALLLGSFGLWEALVYGIGKGLPALRQPTTAVTLVVADANGGVQVRSVSGTRAGAGAARCGNGPVLGRA